MAETEGGTLAVDHSPSLSSFVGEMYGDYSAHEPEQESGTPPAAAASETTATSPEGDATSAPAESTPAVADATATPDTAPPDPVETDPLEGATPFGYAVDGQSKTFDGITVLRDGAGIIEPDAVKQLQQIVSRHDHLQERSRADFEKYSALERATSWQVKDATGAWKTITGPEAVWESRAMSARQAAALNTIGEIFSKESPFRDPETGFIVLSPDQVTTLQYQAKAAALEAVNTARTNFGMQTQAPPPADTPVAEIAGPTVESYVNQFGITGLTPEDKAFLASQLPRYVTGSGATRAVDPSFVEVMKDRAGLRSSQASVAQVAAKAATSNAQKVAAAAIGKKPVPQAARITPAPPAKTDGTDYDTAWDRNMKAASGAMRAHQLGL